MLNSASGRCTHHAQVAAQPPLQGGEQGEGVELLGGCLHGALSVLRRKLSPLVPTCAAIDAALRKPTPGRSFEKRPGVDCVRLKSDRKFLYRAKWLRTIDS